MKIVFLGDSLTSGIPGVGYVSKLEQKLKEHEIINWGKGGDTVISLLNRINSLSFPEDIDIIVLTVGTNDQFVNISKSYPLIKKLANQPWARDLTEFEKSYCEIISILHERTKRIIIVPPLLLGENLNSKWNVKLDTMSIKIKEIASKYDDVTFLDVRDDFKEYLKNRSISSYIANNAFIVISDAILLKSNISIDNKSTKRGLNLTLDGVHLNSLGAEMLAEAIFKEI